MQYAIRTLSRDASSQILQNPGTGTYTCFLCGAWELLLDMCFFSHQVLSVTYYSGRVNFPLQFESRQMVITENALDINIRTSDRGLVELICSFFVASWTGVVKYHGPRPSIRPKQIFVANHTSMIDFIVLEQVTAFAVIMQKHPGWVGLLQSTILESLGCIWFNRSESKDREIVARKLREHVHGADNNPLLVFPEGTCVNNHYTVMFKKGAFELGCTVCQIAIKYNKIFVDAFWNSRNMLKFCLQAILTTHLLQLMTSWAVVCDVWYLEPQNLKPGETPIEFAERVRDIISVRAGLKKVPWDGYLKYSRPSPKHRERKQQSFAESVLSRLEER
ncbi:hypothetical protein DH2020_044724 [Rehmannia glutinosa]|uniref:Phospholipid/glycerol acyltransferase domain-containing protein n=1 Tax=Rehmannia glutinosa TaxID=99300 RepID=A0ABR0UGW2_REHGL